MNQETDHWHDTFARVRGSLRSMGLSTDCDRVRSWIAQAQKVHGFPSLSDRPNIRDLPLDVLVKLAEKLEETEFQTSNPSR